VRRAAALAGTGIVLLPDFLIAEDIQAGRLETALPGWRGPELAIQAVWPSGRHVPTRLRLFLDFLSHWLSRTPPWRRGEEIPAALRR
jgi:DNA-binding transcriptional LysR family regulator